MLFNFETFKLFIKKEKLFKETKKEIFKISLQRNLNRINRPLLSAFSF